MAKTRSLAGRVAWFLRQLLARAALGVSLGLLLLLVRLPWDAGSAGQLLQTGLGALLVVCSLGKALYDTLFYDHYRP
jgi:hypothetical protein